MKHPLIRMMEEEIEGLENGKEALSKALDSVKEANTFEAYKQIVVDQANEKIGKIDGMINEHKERIAQMEAELEKSKATAAVDN